MQTVRVNYTGRVQGVGFRYTVSRIAKGHPVAGYVKNLPDGSVELVAQGLSAHIEAFLADVASRFAANIRGIDRHLLDSAETFSEFEIRH